MRLAALALCAGLVAVAAADAPARAVPTDMPVAAEIVVPRVFARRSPDSAARVVRVLTEFRSDFRPRVVLVLEARITPSGAQWYRVSLPGRPNGQRGWIPGDAVRLRRVVNRIVVHRSARRLEVRRLADAKVLLRAPVAVGTPDAPTPLGHDFYVQSALHAERPVLRPVRPRDERLLAAERLAGRRHRRHPRNEPTGADRAGRVARLHPDAERGRRAPPPARRRRDAGGHRAVGASRSR